MNPQEHSNSFSRSNT